MGVSNEKVDQWLDISQNIASTMVSNNQFVEAALELAEATAINGMSYHSVVEDYSQKPELSKKLDVEIQQKRKEIAGLKEGYKSKKSRIRQCVPLPG